MLRPALICVLASITLASPLAARSELRTARTSPAPGRDQIPKPASSPRLPAPDQCRTIQPIPITVTGKASPGQPDELATPWIADLHNPILKPWVADILRKNAQQQMAGVEDDTELLHCRPDGVPGVLTRRDNVSLLQSATEVTIVYQIDNQVRHVYLNVPHSPHPAKSWYGESGWSFRRRHACRRYDRIKRSWPRLIITAHPTRDSIHVVERYRVVDGGKSLQVDFTVDDPAAFNTRVVWNRSLPKVQSRI